MSEERRMITEEQWSLGASEWSWLEFEVAPVDGWRPMCFYIKNSQIAVGCNGVTDGLNLWPECQQCIYRRKD